MKSAPRKRAVREIAVVTASGTPGRRSWLRKSLTEEAKRRVKEMGASEKRARSQKDKARAKGVSTNVARTKKRDDAIARYIKANPGAHTKTIRRLIEKDIEADTKEIESAKANGSDLIRLKLNFPRRTKNGAPYSIGELQKKIAAMRGAAKPR